MPEDIKKEELKEEKVEKAGEEKVEKAEKAEPTISEDELLKAITSLEDIIKARKPKEEEEEEEEEEDELEESFTDNFDDDETIEKAIEVSDFLKALVEESSTSIAAVGKEVSRLKKSQDEFDGKHIEALKQFGEAIKGFGTKMDEKFTAIEKRLETIEQTPITKAKSVTKAVALEKSFAGQPAASEFDQLSKRQVLPLLEKAVGDGKIKDTVLFGYESNPVYPLTEDQKEILKSYIK